MPHTTIPPTSAGSVSQSRMQAVAQDQVDLEADAASQDQTITQATTQAPPLVDTLSHAHRNTYKALFRHPTSQNLHWRDVLSLLQSVAIVTTQDNGNLRVELNGHSMILHPDKHKDIDTFEQLKLIRTFLKTSRKHIRTVTPALAALVLIDARHARVFTSLSQHAKALHIPQQASSHAATTHPTQGQRVHDGLTGQRTPEDPAFLNAVADALAKATDILIMGPGTGSASVAQALSEHLQTHRKAIFAAVRGVRSINMHHATDNQLLALAREALTPQIAVTSPIGD